MRKILSIILMCLASITNAQVRSVQQQSELNHWFDLIEYDSLASTLDTNTAPANWLWQTQTYFFWDNSKIHGWLESPSKYSSDGKGYWKGSQIEWVMFNPSSPLDTIFYERLYMDVQGRDSAFMYVMEPNTFFEDRIITIISYDSNNTVESRIHIGEMSIFNWVADTGRIEKFFYDSDGKLDSIISTSNDGVRYPGGYYFEKNNQGKVSKVFEIWPINEKGGQLDTVAIQEAVFKDSLVNEIRYYNYDYRFGKDSVYFGGVLRFAKKHNSTIGMEELNKPGFALFPNPVNEYFVLTIDEGIPASSNLKVFDVSGRDYKVSVVSAGSNLKVDCTTLKSGVYLGVYKASSGEVMKFRFVK